MVSLLPPLSLVTVSSALEIPPGAVRVGCMRLFPFLAEPRHWMGFNSWEMVQESQREAMLGTRISHRVCRSTMDIAVGQDESPHTTPWPPTAAQK